MATKKKKTGRPKKATVRSDQPGLDGIADEKNPKVESAAKSYVRFRDARQEATEDETAAHNALIAAMDEAGITTYEHGGIVIVINEGDRKAKVKVADKSQPKDEAA